MMIKEEYVDDSKESSAISIGKRHGSVIELDNPSSDYFSMSNDSK